MALSFCIVTNKTCIHFIVFMHTFDMFVTLTGDTMELIVTEYYNCIEQE